MAAPLPIAPRHVSRLPVCIRGAAGMRGRAMILAEMRGCNLPDARPALVASPRRGFAMRSASSDGNAMSDNSSADESTQSGSEEASSSYEATGEPPVSSPASNSAEIPLEGDPSPSSSASAQQGPTESSFSPSAALQEDIFLPPSQTDWRTFRAKLVASSGQMAQGALTDAKEANGLEVWQERISLENWALLSSQNPLLAKEVPWVHPTPSLEAGGILIAASSDKMGVDRRYWQAVVFLLHHSAGKGSWGLILNRPSGYTIQKAMAQVNHVEAALSVFASNAIYVGGFRSDGRTMYCLHGHEVPGAEQVVPGIFIGGMQAAAEKVLRGAFPPLDFRFFVGRVEWLPGKLEEEVRQGMWISAACSRSLILKQCILLPKPLWREVLELMGGEYADIAKAEYGEK